MWINVPLGTYSLTANAIDSNGLSTTSTAVNVIVTATAPSAPIVSISSPISGSDFTAPASVVLTATASEINGAISKVAFYNGTALLGTVTSSPYSFTWSNAPAGNYSLTAIAYDNSGNQTTSTALAVGVYSLPVVSLASNNTSFTAPATVILTASASEVNGTISKVSFYNGSALLGTVTTSPYRLIWISVPVGNYNLTAIAYDNNSNQTTSTAVAIAVSGLPVVSLASNNTSFTAPASIVLTAAASESNGTISKVAFYNGSTLLGTVTSSPYSFTWRNASVGNYSLMAIAYDNSGNQTTSTAITVGVHGLPIVSMASNNTSFTAPASIILTATASENNGTISKVAFYNGSSLLGIATSSPYNFTWNNVAAGTYSLTSVATDSGGVTTISSMVSVKVSPAGPTVSLTSPVNNASYTTPANLILTASASETNGIISKVVFYNGSSIVGTATSSPYRLMWINVPSGTYSLTAKATDSVGVSTISTAVRVTISTKS